MFAQFILYKILYDTFDQSFIVRYPMFKHNGDWTVKTLSGSDKAAKVSYSILSTLFFRFDIFSRRAREYGFWTDGYWILPVDNYIMYAQVYKK